jgi:primosomal protein N' (replication factor Y)
MHYYEVAPNQIVRLGSDVFTYHFETELTIGQVVSIQIGKKSMIGIIMQSVNKPSYDTKPIATIIYDQPLPLSLVNLASWISTYYNTPLALVIQTILPHGIQKKRRSISVEASRPNRVRTNIVFTDEQLSALQEIKKSQQGSLLLQGVTGSGKTEIYIETVKQAIADNKSAIILVPEIALTSQIVADFSHHFENILVVHSTITESRRHAIWQEALESDKPRVVIGARSALFTPLRNIGIIIIDECHEPSYKQDQSPKYSALRAASIMGKSLDAKVIFGSATPSIVDRYLAENSGNKVIRLTKPARKLTLAPTILLIDMTKRANFSGQRFLTKQLLKQLDKTLQDGKQALIFHNRRGSASTTLCENCGWTAECPRCYIPLSLHADQHNLRCHICNFTQAVPTSCPICHHVEIIHKGFGTKLIESELRKLYPKANIARFDADNHDSETVNARYSELYDGTIDIAIGTQVIAKGLDLPHLRTVGVIQADSGLALPDFSSSERTFQLLSQVVGRVGRNEHATQVIVQSYQPLHPSIAFGLTQDYESFYKYALSLRKKGLFPPFTHLLKLTCSYKTELAAINSTKKISALLNEKLGSNISILGPTPAFYERQRDNYRWQLVIKSPKREFLIKTVELTPKTNWQTDLDPTSLL